MDLKKKMKADGTVDNISKMVSMGLDNVEGTRPDLAYAVSRLSSNYDRQLCYRGYSDAKLDDLTLKDSRTIVDCGLHLEGAISWKVFQAICFFNSLCSTMESGFIALDNAAEEGIGYVQLVVGHYQVAVNDIPSSNYSIRQYSQLELSQLTCGVKVRLSSPAVQQLWTLYPGKQTANLF
ncbi:hypothetical protein Tco_1253868 [Tanacetum coccineum]